MRPRPFAGFVLLTFIFFTSCEQVIDTTPLTAPEPAVSAGEIAFEMASPGEAAILVPVTINGKGPFQFVLDTGATLTCVGEHLTADLALPVSTTMRGIGASIGASGNIKLVDLATLTIGGATLEDVTACSIDLGNVKALGITADGLLGLNVLKQFDVAIDFERQVLRLTKPAEE
jgi:predicted aspartyl protease